jgi:hypothetical protein
MKLWDGGLLGLVSLAITFCNLAIGKKWKDVLTNLLTQPLLGV